MYSASNTNEYPSLELDEELISTLTGEISLHVAARAGKHDNVVQSLKKDGVDVNAVNKDGKTPLHVAVKSGHIGIVDLLFRQKNINLEIKDNFGNTALDIAKREGNQEIARILQDAASFRSIKRAVKEVSQVVAVHTF